MTVYNYRVLYLTENEKWVKLSFIIYLGLECKHFKTDLTLVVPWLYVSKYI